MPEVTILSTAPAEKPIALLVEDNNKVLNDRRELIRGLGYHAIAVSNADDAWREFRCTPAIDIVITDVSLVPNNHSDRSGIELARKIKAQQRDMPVVGYSAYFNEKDMRREDLDLFTKVVLRAELPTKIVTMFEGLKDEALECRRRRVEESKREVERLRKNYRFTPSEENSARAVQPGARRADEVEIPLAVEDRRDEGELGYIPDQIPAGWEVVLETGERIKTRIPVPIFLLKEVNYAVADLRGHNMLYSEHETPEGAIEALLILMFSYHQDFRKQAGSPFGPALAQLRDDLTNIFG